MLYLSRVPAPIADHPLTERRICRQQDGGATVGPPFDAGGQLHGAADESGVVYGHEHSPGLKLQKQTQRACQTQEIMNVPYIDQMEFQINPARCKAVLAICKREFTVAHNNRPIIQ